MPVLYWVLALVAAQRLVELWLSARNTRRLLARGAREVGAGHYPLMVVLHAGWLVMTGLTTSPLTQPSWPLLGLYLALQAARVWVIASLGPYWTTRIITLDGAPLVKRGPYRWLRHPNYLIVALEIAILALAFGLPAIALIFTLLNASALAVRITAEARALAPLRLE